MMWLDRTAHPDASQAQPADAKAVNDLHDPDDQEGGEKAEPEVAHLIGHPDVARRVGVLHLLVEQVTTGLSENVARLHSRRRLALPRTHRGQRPLSLHGTPPVRPYRSRARDGRRSA